MIVQRSISTVFGLRIFMRFVNEKKGYGELFFTNLRRLNLIELFKIILFLVNFYFFAKSFYFLDLSLKES